MKFHYALKERFTRQELHLRQAPSRGLIACDTIKTIMRAIAVVFIVCSSLALVSCQQEVTMAPVGLQLDSQIQPATPEKYKSVIDATRWANPYLVVGQDGVEVLSKTMTPNRQLVAVKDLRKTLLQLPVSAWPYGRVVAIQTPGILGDKPGLEKQNVFNTEQLLQSLQIEVERWPSA